MKIALNKTKGFTLVEVAVALVIVGFIIAGLLSPLAVQRDLRDYQATRAELAEIREALIGYALSQARPHLPCPDIDLDGEEDRGNDGACERDQQDNNIIIFQGSIPWVTLGIGRVDSWNNNYIYSATDVFTNSNGFALNSVGGNGIFDSAATATAAANDNEGNVAANIPVVIVSMGRNRQGNAGSVDEQENVSANERFVSHDQIDVAGNEFDDIVVWIPASLLFSRMLSAGLLP